jgi:hypothetical protein
MHKAYDIPNLRVYFGSSLLSSGVVANKSCKIAMFTPPSEKNLLDHGYSMTYTDFIDEWIRLFDKFIVDDGSFFVGCIPPDVDLLKERFALQGYKFAENLEFDNGKLPDSIAGKYKWEKNPYLVFTKSGIGSGLDVDTIAYPKELQRQFILSMSKEGDTVFHPFANSSKPSAICYRINRKCIVISNDRYWCTVAYKRATDDAFDAEFSVGLL